MLQFKKGGPMTMQNNALKLNGDEYVSQVAFYLKDKLIKIKRLKKKFDISDLENLQMKTDKVVCFVENSEKTSKHKITLVL